MDVGTVRQDLIDEQEALDFALRDLEDADWARASASPGWTVADQIGHLAYFDRAASVAITEPASFAEMRRVLWEAATTGHDAVDQLTLGAYRAMATDPLVDSWRRGRESLAAASNDLTDTDRVEWYGPSMGSKSFLTARLMECWAHGTDAVEAVGRQLPATDRLAHIARLGVITRRWSYANRGLEAPDEPVALSLRAPSGAVWELGDADADASVEGPALDFCLVVTQRRHVDDTDLVVTPLAREWLLIAQAFAGQPTDGPPPSR